MASTTSSTTDLIDKLPRELRDDIYDLAITMETPFRLISTNNGTTLLTANHTHHEALTTFLNLLCTSKNINAEVTKRFFKANDFFIATEQHLPWPRYHGLPTLKTFPRRLVKELCHVKVIVDWPSPPTRYPNIYDIIRKPRGCGIKIKRKKGEKKVEFFLRWWAGASSKSYGLNTPDLDYQLDEKKQEKVPGYLLELLEKGGWNAAVLPLIVQGLVDLRQEFKC